MIITFRLKIEKVFYFWKYHYFINVHHTHFINVHHTHFINVYHTHFINVHHTHFINVYKMIITFRLKIEKVFYFWKYHSSF
jgi:hypothetical protein